MSLDNVLPMSLDSFVTYVLDPYKGEDGRTRSPIPHLLNDSVDLINLIAEDISHLPK